MHQKRACNDDYRPPGTFHYAPVSCVGKGDTIVEESFAEDLLRNIEGIGVELHTVVPKAVEDTTRDKKADSTTRATTRLRL